MNVLDRMLCIHKPRTVVETDRQTDRQRGAHTYERIGTERTRERIHARTHARARARAHAHTHIGHNISWKTFKNILLLTYLVLLETHITVAVFVKMTCVQSPQTI